MLLGEREVAVCNALVACDTARELMCALSSWIEYINKRSCQCILTPLHKRLIQHLVGQLLDQPKQNHSSYCNKSEVPFARDTYTRSLLKESSLSIHRRV